MFDGHFRAGRQKHACPRQNQSLIRDKIVYLSRLSSFYSYPLPEKIVGARSRRSYYLRSIFSLDYRQRRGRGLATVYLGLGSNVGDRHAHLLKAYKGLREVPRAWLLHNVVHTGLPGVHKFKSCSSTHFFISVCLVYSSSRCATYVRVEKY